MCILSVLGTPSFPFLRNHQLNSIRSCIPVYILWSSTEPLVALGTEFALFHLLHLTKTHAHRQLQAARTLLVSVSSQYAMKHDAPTEVVSSIQLCFCVFLCFMWDGMTSSHSVTCSNMFAIWVCNVSECICVCT